MSVDRGEQVGHVKRVTKSVTAKIRMSPKDRDLFARRAAALGISFSGWALMAMKKAVVKGEK